MASVSKDEAVIDLLRQLYSQHGVLPAPVLLILLHAVELKRNRALGEPLKKTARGKKADMVRLDKAIRVIRDYYDWQGGALARHNTISYLQSLKAKIENTGPKKKESDVSMRFVAQTLRQFFLMVTGHPLDEHVGKLMCHALKWPRSRGDLRLAVVDRAKGPKIKLVRFALTEALDLQREDYSYWEKYLDRWFKCKGPPYDSFFKAASDGEKLFIESLKKESREFPLGVPWRAGRSISPKKS